MELFPAIDLRDGGAVRLVQGDFARRQRDYGDPVALARRYAAGGARWIHVVDLGRGPYRVSADRETVLRVARAVDVAVQAGGGVRCEADAAALLDHGVARVVVGTLALEHPDVLEAVADRYPGRVAVGLDHRGGGAEVAVEGWHRASATSLAAAWRG